MKHFKEWKECQPKPPKLKMLRAWIETFDKIGNNRDSPLIWFDKPTKREIEIAKEYDCHYYPCVITYNLSTPLTSI